MNILDILKSRGLSLFVVLFVLLNVLVTFTMSDFRAYWTLGIIELIAVFFYIVVQLIPTSGESLWTWNKKE